MAKTRYEFDISEKYRGKTIILKRIRNPDIELKVPGTACSLSLEMYVDIPELRYFNNEMTTVGTEFFPDAEEARFVARRLGRVFSNS